MTTPIKTQCPHCQAYFNIQQTQLNKVNATVSCDQCHQSFLVNKNLVVTSDTSNSSAIQSTKAKRPNTKPSLNQKRSSDTLIHDDLIYDDMDIDEPDDNPTEYASLDSMDAWLTQVSNTPSTTETSATGQHSPSDIKHKNNDPMAKSATTHVVPESSSIAQEVLSSAAANDIHASVDDTTDNSWLEALLDEQSKRDEKPINDTDLSQLLIDMGVPIRDEEISAAERAKIAQAHFAPTSAALSIASILWILGCLVLALLLAAQYVMFNLETLVKNPANAKRLQAVCSVAACSLPSADLTAFTITTPNHRASQIQTAGTFSDISATLNNQSTQAQLYPNIKVSVYGADSLIGEFIAAPTDYLLGKQSQLPANDKKRLLFTIPVDDRQIREVTMTPLY